MESVVEAITAEDFDQIADEIERVAKAIGCLKKSKLKPETMYLLIAKNTVPRMGVDRVKRVLQAAEGLADRYLKKTARQS